MFKRMILLLIAAAFLLLQPVSQAKTLNLKDEPFSAVGDGRADDRPALKRAMFASRPGDTVLIPPGHYRIVLTGGALTIQQGVTLLGEAGKSVFLLGTDGKNSDYREFLRPQSDVLLEGITIERDADFTAILFAVSGDANNFGVRNCTFTGNQSRFCAHDCHAIRVGFGVVKNFTLDGTTIQDCCYGLFQPNSATGTLDGMTVEHCRFERNTASDLEFNSPNGVMRNIDVRECFFGDNRSKTSAGGFAVGFANVTGGRVENCVMRNYGSEALHVEDRSSDIRLVANTICAGSLRQSNGVIMVVNNSKAVEISGNVIDARQNTNRTHLILVTAGGKSFANPTDVSVTDNILVNGPSTQTWYLQPGSGPAPAGNLIVPESPTTRP
jgi:hypothetical protein